MAVPTRSYVPSTTGERWQPLQELEALHEQMDQLMANAWSVPGFGNGKAWTPLVDVEEAEDAWIVEAEIPGVKKKDVNVEMRDSELSISGEIKERERKGILRRRTRKTGRFDYRVTLPGQADAENIDADLNDGVLKVRIPKSEQARSRRIDVKSGRS